MHFLKFERTWIDVHENEAQSPWNRATVVMYEQRVFQDC